MGNYKARRSDNSNESVEEIPKTQEEIDNENNANLISNAADVAIATNIPYAVAAGYAVKGIDKITGGKASQGLGKVLTTATKSSPGGRQIQNLANQANESGLVDAVGQAASMSNGAQNGGKIDVKTDALKSANSSGGSSKGSSNSSNSSGIISNNIMPSFGMGGGFKIKIAVVCIACIFMIFMTCFSVFAQKDQQNLALTNETVLAHSSAGSVMCNSTQIAQKAIYVGDSRTVGLKAALESTDSTFIAESSQGLNWLKNVALSELETKLSEDQTAVVIFALGVNDLYNVDGYITTYNEIIQNYPTANYFILSVNPVDEVKAQSNGYSTTNADIEAFNQKMQAAFPDKYIDSYSNIKSSLGTTDGLHYDASTYQNINDFVMSNISNNYNIICSIGSISSIDESSLSGGNANILRAGESLLSLLGQEKIDSWTASIKSDVQAAGIGSGGAPAMAAYGLVQGALNEGIIIPYFWGGGHGAISDGVNGSWGSATVITAGGSSAQPAGSIQASGLDCSGFVSWALKNGGCSSFTPILASSFKSLGSGIDASKAVTGDIAASNTHVMIILNNTGSSLIIAEAKGSKYGVIFEEYDYSHFNKYKIVSMSDYYAKNCNG